MKKYIGNYDICFKNLYNSLRKRYLSEDFGTDTLEGIDLLFEDREVSKYPVILISNDDTYSEQFIKELNGRDNTRGYCFYYKDGNFNGVNDLKEKIKHIFYNSDNSDIFIYVSVSKQSGFRLEIPGSICIKQGKFKDLLSLDIIKTFSIMEGEIIRRACVDDYDGFNELLEKLNQKKWENHPNLFDMIEKYSLQKFKTFCRKNNYKSIFVCKKNNKIIGFLIIDYVASEIGKLMNGDSFLTIKDIFVLEEFRRNGVAKRMYEEVIKCFKRKHNLKFRFRVLEGDYETEKFILSLHPKVLYSLYELDV